MGAPGFLDLVRRRLGDRYDGDQYGGAAGSDGRGLPAGGRADFMFGTGVECSYRTIDGGRTRRSLAQKRGTVNACGLYDLARRPRPVAAAYRQLLEEFGRITTVPHGERFEVTDRPAR